MIILFPSVENRCRECDAGEKAVVSVRVGIESSAPIIEDINVTVQNALCTWRWDERRDAFSDRV
jgi:hypothetical protein